MATMAKLPLEEPLRGVRMLPRQGGLAATAAKVQWLLQLGEARARRDAEQQALVATARAVQRTLQELGATLTERLDQVTALTVELALAVAREIIDEAIERGAVDPTPTVVHCLRDCVHGTSGTDLTLHLHPDDLGPVMGRLAGMPELRQQLAACRLLPDPALARGGVRAETAAGRLRHDPRELFERVAAAVRSAAAGSGA